jgi:hypothetical protein
VWMGLVSEDVAAEVVNAISKKTTNIQQTRRTAP